VADNEPDEDRRADLLATVNDANATTHLVLGWRGDGAGYRLQLGELETSVASDFLDFARGAAANLQSERTAVPYDPDWQLQPHEFFELVDDLPGGSLFEELNGFLNLSQFKRKQLTKPQFYVVAVQGADRLAFFGRRMANLHVLKKKKGVLPAIWDGSTFNDLDQSVATFASTFHWIKFEDRLYVLDRAGFHAQFRDVPQLLKAAQDNVDIITSKLPIKGADLLVERCQSNPQMASKLARVAEDGLWQEGQDALKDYANEFDLEVDWDGQALVFDGTIERQWTILKLLDEDRTEGPVSGRHYESSSKRQV